MEEDQIQAHTQGGNGGGSDPGPHPRGKWRAPPGTSLPSPLPREADCSIQSMSGRCASYWNAFLWNMWKSYWNLYHWKTVHHLKKEGHVTHGWATSDTIRDRRGCSISKIQIGDQYSNYKGFRSFGASVTGVSLTAFTWHFIRISTNL